MNPVIPSLNQLQLYNVSLFFLIKIKLYEIKISNGFLLLVYFRC